MERGTAKCWDCWSRFFLESNKPRCYPQQRLGNNASKENLRATLPNPKPFQKTFSIRSYVRTGMHLSCVTTTTHTRASATGSPREPSRNPVPVRNQIVFNTFWNVPSRTLPGPPEPIRNLGALPGTCPGTFLNPHAPEPWNPAQNLPQNLDRNPGTFPEPCPGTLPRNLPRNPWLGSRPGTAPEPILAKTP